jgi:receptor-binding and translocation channel-forming TcA subunit of Tc toxin/ABC toxin-like protein/neuraminidase-like protein
MLHRITPTLKINDTGEEVANLQDALRLLVDKDRLKIEDLSTKETLLHELARERDSQFYGDGGTFQLVRRFQAQQRLSETGEVDAPTAGALNKLLEELGAIEEPPQFEFLVQGQVQSTNGGLGAGMTVCLFDRDLRSEEKLGEVTIDEQGGYEIRYTAAQFRRAEKGTADLRVAVCEPGGREIATSGIHFNAPTKIIIDLTLPSTELAPSEYERYLDTLKDVMQGFSLTDLREDSEYQDISFLAGDTSIPRDHIAFLAKAAALEEASAQAAAPGRAPAAAFYGWFRQGLPTEPALLWKRSTADLLAEIKRAIEMNIVPRALSKSLGELEVAINQLRAARALDPAPAGEPASLGDLLNTLPENEALSEDEKHTFARLRDGYGDTEELWKQAEAAGLSQAIPSLKRTLALDRFTMGHPSLMQALQTKSDAERPESVSFLIAVEPVEWIELVFEHGAPPASDLERDAYIEHLQIEVEHSFPTQALSRQIERNLSRNERFPAQKVLSFLHSNPDFDLKAKHVEPFLIEKGIADDELREGMLQVLRLRALTLSSMETVQLLDAGFGSASQIVSEGPAALMRKMGGKISPERVEGIHNAAKSVVSNTIALSSVYGSLATSAQGANVISKSRAPGADTLKMYPSLRTLFGDMDYCECRHCRSVLGPAAYLADLMHFLQRSPLIPNTDGDLSPANLEKNANGLLNHVSSFLELAADGTVLGALLRRRPDLADLELSCENTNTEIPYIDLVLEIIENAVALPLVVDPSKYANIDVAAEFADGSFPDGHGKIPDVVLQALAETDITIGEKLTVTEYIRSAAPGAGDVLNTWIIKDGSRRWFVRYVRPQLLYVIADAASGQFIPGSTVLDVEGAVDALEHGTFNAELEDKLSRGLPFEGAPQIQKIQAPSDAFMHLWTASYTRGVAIRETHTGRLSLVEVLELDGITPIRNFVWPFPIPIIALALTSSGPSKINAFVALLLEIPADELYMQTLNPAGNLLELRTRNTAWLAHMGQLAVSGLSYQNSSIREDLKSSPENRNPAAYKKLSENAVFPWTLPFDLWLEETRAFLEALGVSRSKLIDLARPQSRLSEAAAALELQGLSKSEADLITSAIASAAPWTYWGLTEHNNKVKDHVAGSERSGDWNQILSYVSMLLQQSGLSYREYLDFRQTGFAWQSKGVLFPPNECKTSNITLIVLNPAQFADHLSRIHVFTRLWRKSGWSMRELDLALTVFGDLSSSTFSVADFADLESFASKLKQPGRPVDIWLADQLSPTTTTILANYQSPDSDPAPLQEALVQDLNSILRASSIYDSQRFNGVSLRPATQQLLSQNPQGAGLIQLNRLLLEDAYPLELMTLELSRNTILQDLALIKRLRAITALPVSALLGCIDKLGTAAWMDHTKEGTPIEPAFYDSVFQRPSLRSLTHFEDFALDKVLSASTIEISERADFVAASLGLSPRQVNAWLSGAPNLGVEDVVTLDSLSRLYSAALLCRALGIAPAALPDIVTLLEVNPFRTLTAPATPEEQARVRARATLDFVERVGAVRESGFDFETLGYLLRHKTLSGGTTEAATRIEREITRTLTALRSALQTGVVLGDVSANNLMRQLARRGWYPALIDQATGSDGLNYQPGASVDIEPPLDDDPVIPLDLQSKFSYRKLDADIATLRCAGSLADEDFQAMEDLNLFPAGRIDDLKTQYNEQLQAHVDSLVRLLRIIELEELPELEEDVNVTALPVIPGELAGRLRFAPTTGKLSLTGWLTDRETEAFSDANPTLSAAITSLQTRAENKIPSPSGTMMADAERILREPDIVERFRTVLLRLVPHLELEFLAAQLSPELGLDQQVVIRLLDAAEVKLSSAKTILTDSNFLRSDRRDPVNRTPWHDQFAVVELLRKIATIGARLAIRPEQWDWILGKAFSILDALALPVSATDPPASFEHWRRLVDLFHLRDALPDGPARLTRIEAALREATFDAAPIHKEFAGAFDLSESEVETACSAELLDFKSGPVGNDYRNPSRLLELAQLLHVIKSLGSKSNDIKLLIKSAPDRQAAELARKLFVASINTASLPERLRPITDRLRNLRRDALVAYLIYRDQLADADELFDRYLIDAQMGSCMITSRIKQAISSVQLFVQRCLLNLEQRSSNSAPGVRPDSIDAERWQWMKFYRVWEANRKIFLYPENWIEPTLRDDKSEIFRAFETDLLQSEISHDTALAAYNKYLDRLSDIANLTVVSMFEERLADRTIVHVVGRDNSEPYKHYYRQWKLLDTQEFGTWTAWEEITARVNSDHVLVFLFGGNVYLAWPSISSSQGKNPKWKIGMNLAKRATSGWESFKKGRDEAQIPMDPFRDGRTGLAFRTRYNADRAVSIEIYGPPDQGAEVDPQETKGPEAKFAPLARGSNTDPHLDLKLRALARYTYEKADASTQLHYGVDRATNIQVEMLATVIGTSGNTIDQKLTASIPGGFDHSGAAATLPWDLMQSGFLSPVQIQSIKEMTITFPGSLPMKIVPLAQPVWNSFIWHQDSISDRPPASTQAQLVKRASFILKDNDSFELESKAGSLDRLDVLPGSESFISGYRELDSPPDELVLSLGRQVLTETPGRYFIVGAQSSSDLATREIWAYRDDQFSLLFWPGAGGYRVVPFSTAGMTELKSAVTKGRLAEAVGLQLPGSVEPISLHVGTGIEVRDPGAGYLASVTQVDIDFGKAPTSIYNWEVFFHIPLLVATQLSRAQRFEEAQRWFHLIFDPTTDDPEQKSIRYWRFKPFREEESPIDKRLEDLAKGNFSLQDEIEEWAENPFRPHLIARQRVRSYKFAVVQKYLENLIAWGDQMFRRDTIESINEATQLYILAARILGRRPAASPRSASSAKSYRDIQSRLDDFSNAWIPLEPFAFRQSSNFNATHNLGPSAEQLFSLGSLYFCVPGNEKLFEYWDTVEDRLFKIRHCMNLEGIERQLPLFEPPIDPALLVRATAMGLDLGEVLSDLEAPLPLYRFNVSAQKALEMCAEVRALGSALLSAIEKQDAEELSRLRSGHEIEMLKLSRNIKEQQKNEADANLTALRKTREVIAERYINYQRLMGKQNVAAPAEDASVAQEHSTLQFTPPSANGIDATGLALTTAESSSMDSLNHANDLSLHAGRMAVMAGIFHTFPDISVSASVGIGIVSGSVSTTMGGSHLGAAASAVGTGFDVEAKNATYHAGLRQTIGGYQRRHDEWRFQSNLAARELEQIDKQIIANKIRKQIAERELENHEEQIANAEEVDRTMRDKYTNQELYSWMVGQISSVYFRTYQLAHQMSKRVERAYRFELGLPDSSFIEYGYWDTLKKGLMAGERLYLDLKRMDAAYLEQNRREYEITKHVSLLSICPEALIQLRQIGCCEFSIPEIFYDLDCPGHFMRRIKSVSLTIPCVTGPYTGVHCTLTLLSSSVRKSAAPGSRGYARDVEQDDSRFIDDYSSIQSIVTSAGQADSGIFETNLRDERYLPFEGSGAISAWRLELPREFRAFDYDTISDVVLHMRYTAREGGELLRGQAVAELSELVNSLAQPDGQQGLARVFSLRHEFPTEWRRFLNPAASDTAVQTLTMALTRERFPFLVQGRISAINSMNLLVKIKPEFSISHSDSTLKLSLQSGTEASDIPLTLSTWSELLRTDESPGGSLGNWTLTAWLGDEDDDDDVRHRLEPDAIQDILLICRYTCS